MFLGLYLAGWLLLDRHPRTAITTLSGFVMAGLLLRMPPDIHPPSPSKESWAADLRGCALLPEPARQAVRVLSWTLDAQQPAPTAESILRERPDIAVLVGLNDPAVAESVASQLGGEALYLPGGQVQDGISLIVRGVFQYCAGRDDSWEIPFASGDGERARAILTFPEVAGAGVVPFVAVKLPGPGASSTWSTWPARVADGAQLLGSLSTSIGPRRLVIAGDFGAPRTFHDLAAPLLGAGLMEVPVPPSWPAHVGPVPLPGLHALDRVWTGGAWRPQEVRRGAPNGQRRAPIVVSLAPANAQAR